MKHFNMPSVTRYLAVALLLLLTAPVFCQTPAAPATCTASIGTPANGTAHHITINWASVSGATAYILQYSYDGTTWNVLDSANVTTYDHNASNTGNIPVYYRVKAFETGNESGFTNSTPYPIYTACDFPALPTLSNAGASNMTIVIPAESPTPNAAATTYAIYCITTGQYVQANGTLGSSLIYQTRSAWGTITLTGLTASTNYCFYSIAQNGNGDTRVSAGNSITAAQTFDATGSLNTSINGTTAAYWTPPQPTSYPSRLEWLSTGGCSGGTGAGNVGFAGSFTNYFGSFLRTPAVNCTGNTTVVLSCDISNSYITSHITSTPSSCDAINFNMYVGSSYYNATSIKINGVEVSHTDGNGIWLEFDAARTCTEVDVTYNLAPYSDISGVLFYINPQNPYNDQYNYSVNIDNVSISAGTGSSCLSTTACTTATISTNPLNQTACAGGNTSFSVVAAGSVASYQWQVSTDAGATWNNVSNGGVYTNATTSTLNLTSVTTALNSYQYRCLVTGSCSGNPTSNAATLTVGSATGNAGTITGTAAVCQGQNGVAFSVPAVSGATGYSWSLPTGASIATGSGTNSITVNFSGAAASGNVVVTPTSGCGNGGSSTAYAVTVNQLPSALGTISGATNLCNTNAQVYAVSAVNGATSYTWTLPNGWSGSSTTNSITATPTTTGGTITVKANNTCGSTTAQTLTVTTAAAPATPGTISGSSVVCSGISTAYSVVAVSGATSYTWTLPNGWTGTSTTNSITVTPSSSGGNITVMASNNCGNSSTQTLAVSIGSVPATPAAISGPATACNGDQLIYTVAPTNGASSYTWTLPNGWSGTSITDTIRATAGPSGGTITIKADNGCGSSSVVSTTVSAGAVPATPGSISGAASACTGSSPNYSISTVAGATSYTWTLPNGWSGSSTTNSISPVVGATGGSISVTANNACGSSALSQLTVTAGTGLSNPGSISGLTAVCNAGNTPYSIASVTGANSYTWTLPNGWSGSSTTNSITATPGPSGGIISVVANGSCGSSSASQLTVTVASQPAIPGAITGADTVCNSTSSSYGVASVTGALTYTWTLPNGWSGSSTSNAIFTTVGNTGGNIFVTANNACGSSPAQSLAVTVLSTPALPGSINGPDSVCINASAPFSIATVNGATSYSWILPNGWTGNSNTAILTATAGAVGGNILVTAGNLCGNSSAQSKSVSVNQLPQVSFNYTAGDICSNAGPVTLNTGTPTGGTYSGTGVSGNTFNPAIGAGTYVITYALTNGFGCSNNDTASITVKVCTDILNITGDNITIYPNPFSDDVTIQWTGNTDIRLAVIYDMEGREINKVAVPANGTSFNLFEGNLAKGAYLLDLIGSDGQNLGWKKIVKAD